MLRETRQAKSEQSEQAYNDRQGSPRPTLPTYSIEIARALFMTEWNDRGFHKECGSFIEEKAVVDEPLGIT